MSAFGESVTGKIRKINEDSILVENGKVGLIPNLYIVADGMGGHQAGEIASGMAISLIKDFVEESKEQSDVLGMLENAVQNANKSIYESSLSDSKKSGMGTTVVAATVNDGVVSIINVGDSRLYVINTAEDSINQITVDHSYVMELVIRGEITLEEAETHPNKNIITRALGADAKTECDKFTHTLNKGDCLLLCSDGLSNMLTNDIILKICKENKNIKDAVEGLLVCANDRGGIDNISAILYSESDEV